MDESEWNACTEPQQMLAFLRDSGGVSERKLRWFAAACCRRVWHLLDQIGQDTVDVAERYAEGGVSSEEKDAAENLAWWAADGLNYEDDPVWHAGWAAHGAVASNPSESARLAAWAASSPGEKASQCQLLRDIFGNPFRPSPPTTASVLAYNNGAVRRLAEAACAERQLPASTLGPARLAVLADALEEAAVTDAELLGHLRGPGPHIRGCWALDLLLDKG
jgi:hypothetical protein